MFAEPIFLLMAVAGAFIPLILHVLQKNRTVTLPFPTLRFLKLAQKRSSRRIRLENILLWLLRTLIMILLGLAFANPTLRTQSLGFLGRAARDVAVIIDASYSMTYQIGRRTVWDSALEAASEIIQGLAPNDRYCLYLAAENPVALIAEPLGDKERGLSQIKESKAALNTSRLAPALAAAHNALLRVPQRRERELHILTDNQALPWKDFKERTPEDAVQGEPASSAESRPSLLWDAASLDKKTPIFVSLLGAQSPVNFAPIDIELAPAFMFAGASARLSVRIGCNGESSETTVALFLDGKEIARRPVQTGGQRTGAASFVIPPQPMGIHVASVKTPDDNLPADNVFHFLVRVRNQLPTLCVGNENDIVFLRAALKAGADGADTPWVAPDRLSEQAALGSYSCIFLANVLPLSGQVIADLERYVASGGVLVLFPGSRGSLDDYRAWDCLPGFPSEIISYSGPDRNRVLTWDQANHRLLAPLRDSIAIPNISIERCLRWDRLHPQAVRMISAGAQQPFLLQRDYGRGSVLLFSVAANRAWSNFPLSPFYLPLIMQIIEYSAGVGNEPPFTWCSDSAPLDAVVRNIEADMTLVDPEGRPIPIRTVIQSGNMMARVAPLDQPGIYSLSKPDGSQPAIAANIPRSESDLATIDPDTLPDLVGTENVYVATDIESLRKAIEEHRIGRTYSEHLLLLALILAGIEFVYANSLSRRTPDLSSRLAVTSSGQLGGHTH